MTDEQTEEKTHKRNSSITKLHLKSNFFNAMFRES